MNRERSKAIERKKEEKLGAKANGGIWRQRTESYRDKRERYKEIELQSKSVRPRDREEERGREREKER